MAFYGLKSVIERERERERERENKKNKKNTSCFQPKFTLEVFMEPICT